MKYCIKNQSLLTKILWLDTLMGSTNAIIGLFCFNWLSSFLGLPILFIQIVSSIMLLYVLLACFLANQKTVSIPLLRLQVNANWVWTGISLILLLIHWNQATFVGIVYLILQVLVVGGLAYLEGNQILKIQ